MNLAANISVDLTGWFSNFQQETDAVLSDMLQLCNASEEKRYSNTGSNRMGVLNVVIQNADVFAPEAFSNQRLQLGYVQIEHLSQQAQRVDILAFIFRGSANRLDRQTRNRDANMMKLTLPLRFGLHVVGIEKHNTSLLE